MVISFLGVIVLSGVKSLLGVIISLVRVACSASQSTYVKGASVRVACTKSICARGASVVKHLGMDSQFFLNFRSDTIWHLIGD